MIGRKWRRRKVRAPRTLLLHHDNPFNAVPAPILRLMILLLPSFLLLLLLLGVLQPIPISPVPHHFHTLNDGGTDTKYTSDVVVSACGDGSEVTLNVSPSPPPSAFSTSPSSTAAK